MAEQENTRLAERLASIASALVKPAATNGHSVVATELSDEVVTGLAESIVPFIRECITDAINPLMERIAELEAHIVKIEQQPTMVYRGVWDEETMYSIGDFTTDHGSLWHCDRSCTSVKPGSMEGVWTLAVKHGRDLRK